MFDYTREQILEALRSTPKDAIKVSEEERLRALANPLLEKDFENLRKSRELYTGANEALPFSLFKLYDKVGSRKEFENKYFFARKALATWRYNYYFFPDEETLSRLEDIVWAVCDEYTWSLPAHMWGDEALEENLQDDVYTIDLFAAETGAALSEMLVFSGDKLDPIVRKRAERKLKKRIIDRFFEKKNFCWTRGTNNWAAVCGGSVGITLINMLDNEVLLADGIMSLLGTMRTFISGFADDGTCTEGIGYWGYGFGYFVQFADLLLRRTGGKINLFEQGKVARIAAFKQKCFFYGSRMISFSDCGSVGSFTPGFMAKLAEHYPEIRIPASAKLDHYPDVGSHTGSGPLWYLLWTPETLPETADPAVYPLPDAGWYIGNGIGNFGFAAKAGNNAESHNHNDVGAFLTFKNGGAFICDLGGGEYDKFYFDPKYRYDMYDCGSQGHSVPIVNGITQKDGRDYTSTDVKVDDTGISMDIAKAYPCDTLEHLYRDFRFDKDTSVVTLTDRFVFTEEPESVVERFITIREPVVSEGLVRLPTDTTEMSISFDAEVFDCKAEHAEQVYRSGRKKEFYIVDLTAKKPSKDATYTIVIK